MELKWFHDFTFLTMQQRIQKSAFFRVGHKRKSQIAVIIQATWHNNILIFE